MTIKEFITECELFEYSQEYFDILKECSEIELLERYIENSYYQLYNESTLDDEFFTEAADEDKIEEKEALVSQKKKNVFKRIIDWIVKQFKKAKAVFTKLGESIKKTAEKFSFKKGSKDYEADEYPDAEEAPEAILNTLEEIDEIINESLERYKLTPSHFHADFIGVDKMRTNRIKVKGGSKFKYVNYLLNFNHGSMAFDRSPNYTNAVSCARYAEIAKVLQNPLTLWDWDRNGNNSVDKILKDVTLSGAENKGVIFPSLEKNKYGLVGTANDLNTLSTVAEIDEGKLNKLMSTFEEDSNRLNNYNMSKNNFASFMNNLQRCFTDSLKLYTAVTKHCQDMYHTYARLWQLNEKNGNKILDMKQL